MLFPIDTSISGRVARDRKNAILKFLPSFRDRMKVKGKRGKAFASGGGAGFGKDAAEMRV